jgi:hypothetical protein
MVYKVHGTWMDGLPVWVVIDPKDISEFNSGCYNGSILKGLDLDKQKMIDLAEQLNKEAAE